MQPVLGKIEKVDPRKIWGHEAHDFTPWLGANLDRLSAAVGVELELTGREVGVGKYSLDLLAKNLDTNSNVIIENQLSTTDHDHLGKIITYAGGHDAGAVIWISTSLREEHRQALHWLNDRTDSNTEFFGVVLEIIRIGNSDPAVSFHVVAAPNDWRKLRKSVSSVSTERGELYRKYFQALCDELHNEYQFTSSRKASPKNWMTFSSGKRYFRYGHSFAANGRLRVEIYIDSGDPSENAMVFEFFKERRLVIEEKIGSKLVWEELDSKKACRVALYREGAIDSSDSEKEEYRAWAARALLAFRNVFEGVIIEFDR